MLALAAPEPMIAKDLRGSAIKLDEKDFKIFTESMVAQGVDSTKLIKKDVVFWTSNASQEHDTCGAYT